MLTRKEAIDYCLSLQSTYEDYPFHDFNWTVMRHKVNKKMFAAIYEHMGCIWINVKCDPSLTYMWRSAFESVVPAYHMNKTHWNTVFLESDVPRAEIERMTLASFALTEKKIRTGKNREILPK